MKKRARPFHLRLPPPVEAAAERHRERLGLPAQRGLTPALLDLVERGAAAIETPTTPAAAPTPPPTAPAPFLSTETPRPAGDRLAALRRALEAGSDFSVRAALRARR